MIRICKLREKVKLQLLLLLLLMVKKPPATEVDLSVHHSGEVEITEQGVRCVIAGFYDTVSYFCVRGVRNISHKAPLSVPPVRNNSGLCTVNTAVHMKTTVLLSHSQTQDRYGWNKQELTAFPFPLIFCSSTDVHSRAQPRSPSNVRLRKQVKYQTVIQTQTTGHTESTTN